MFLRERNGTVKAIIRRFQKITPLKERYRWLNEKLLLHNYSFRHYCIVDNAEAYGNLTIVPVENILFKGFRVDFEQIHYIVPLPIYDHD